MPSYPVLKVKADSSMVLKTDGHNAILDGNVLSDVAGVLLTDADVTCYATVIGRYDRVIAAQVAMGYLAPGIWSLTLAADVFPTQTGPWTVIVQVYDVTGTIGKLLRTFYATAVESDD